MPCWPLQRTKGLTTVRIFEIETRNKRKLIIIIPPYSTYFKPLLHMLWVIIINEMSYWRLGSSWVLIWLWFLSFSQLRHSRFRRLTRIRSSGWRKMMEVQGNPEVGRRSTRIQIMWSQSPQPLPPPLSISKQLLISSLSLFNGILLHQNQDSSNEWKWVIISSNDYELWLNDSANSVSTT
jgi:hypothetical protein